MGNFQHVHSAGQPLTWLVGLFLLGRPKTAAAGLLRLVSINAKTPTSRRRGFSAPVLENPLYTAAVVARSMEIEDDTVDVCGDVANLQSFTSICNDSVIRCIRLAVADDWC